VRTHRPNARIRFDRFHVVQHLNRSVDEVRRSEMRRLSRRERTPFKRVRFLLLKNPRNLTLTEKDRLSTLARWNAPIVRPYYLKEWFQCFWDFPHPAQAETHLRQAGQPHRLRLSQPAALHHRHLPLLCAAATTLVELITLLGEEPKELGDPLKIPAILKWVAVFTRPWPCYVARKRQPARVDAGSKERRAIPGSDVRQQALP